MTKPRVHPYMKTAEVCRLFGFDTTWKGRAKLRALVRTKLKRAQGKLDHLNPYFRGRTHGLFTIMSLRRLFPERFEPRDELADQLRERFDAIQRQLDALTAELHQQCSVCRKRDDAIADAIRKIRRDFAA